MLFISVFTFIQVNSRIESINSQNAYQANLSSAVVKNNLEATLKESEAQKQKQEQILAKKQEITNTLEQLRSQEEELNTAIERISSEELDPEQKQRLDNALKQIQEQRKELEAVLKSISAQETMHEQTLDEFFDLGLENLKQGKVIDQVVIFNRDGEIVSSTISGEIGKQMIYRDLNIFETLNDPSEDKWLISKIDRAKNQLNIYIGLKKERTENISYIAKLSFPFASIQDALTQVYKPVIVTSLIIILANILFGFLLSKTVIGPIKVLNQTTKIIGSGDLSVRTDIRTGDELQELGDTFNFMTEELVKMKARAENANPLTKLPGNISIHDRIDAEIKGNKKFMVIYCDLDNFKAFNDKYGIAQGDVAIKLTSEVFKEAAQKKGNPDDFLGHEGGDDFILVTTPDKAKGIADHITSEFDKRVRKLYSQEDLTQGHIVAHGRDGSVKEFPIMSISLAGITNQVRKISSYGQVTNIAAEVKKKAKAVAGSTFVIDERTGDKGPPPK
ncbi:MAG: diguanylate cyclase [Candidatus Omnitrophica bacterium]|nr:diguanylate cyclase [Candidatus Omnitrophota bacterium]